MSGGLPHASCENQLLQEKMLNETYVQKETSSVDEVTGSIPLPLPCLSDASRRLYINIRKHSNLLKSYIDVEEVVQYLPFIDDHEVRTDRSISPSDRVELLLKRIEQKKKEGKWEMFLEALSKSNHPYLVEKITGQTTADHTDNNKILREVCADITARAHVPCLTDHFLTHNVLNDRDREKIEAEQRAKGQTSACFVMLTLIPRRISNWYEILKRVLRENEMKDIADKMEAHEKELKDEPRVDNQTATDSGHSDEDRLWVIRQELRNVVYNLEGKRCISEREKHLLEDLMNILKEIETSCVVSLDGGSAATSMTGTRRPIILEDDTSSYDQHQRVKTKGTSALCSSGRKIRDEYRSISEDVKNNDYLSFKEVCCNRNVCTSLSSATGDDPDSAFYDASYSTYGEAVHL